MNKPKRIILSRTDNLGDVVLTIPMAGLLKQQFPGVEIIFIGKTYSEAIIKTSKHIDEFVNIDELQKQNSKNQIKLFKDLKADAIIHVFPNKLIAKLAKIVKVPLRIGTSHRIFHWITCNKLINLGRKNSELHEAQLNIKLLSALGVNTDISLEEIPEYYGFENYIELPFEIEKLLSPDKYNLILHPKSKGSAREWGLKNFSTLISILPKDKFKIFVTGTSAEGELMTELFATHKEIVDLTGRLNLYELVSFISKADGLVAASTGPLHIAAACGIQAIGIFAPMRPIHPGRWQALGKKADFIVKEEYCDDCRKTQDCHCIRDISPLQVKEKLMNTNSPNT